MRRSIQWNSFKIDKNVHLENEDTYSSSSTIGPGSPGLTVKKLVFEKKNKYFVVPKIKMKYKNQSQFFKTNNFTSLN